MDVQTPDFQTGKATQAFDFRDVLRRELQNRQQKNPAYSMRAFARDLDLSASGLSEVLSGKHSLSLRRAITVSKKLGLSEEHADAFIQSACSRMERSGAEKVIRSSPDSTASVTLNSPGAKALLAELQAILESHLNSARPCGKSGEIRVDLRIQIED